jgi:glycine/D-amino acid oxidase-like deaminating enzyme
VNNAETADVLIVGGGIAGAGAAYEMAAFASVIVLERESHCGYHATGRSAASFTENYAASPSRVAAFCKPRPPASALILCWRRAAC